VKSQKISECQLQSITALKYYSCKDKKQEEGDAEAYRDVTNDKKKEGQDEKMTNLVKLEKNLKYRVKQAVRTSSKFCITFQSIVFMLNNMSLCKRS
jgi:hypothetical protein